MLLDPSLESVSVPLPEGGTTTAGALLASVKKHIPSEEGLEAATRVYESASPAMLESYAFWYDVRACLRKVLDPLACLKLFAGSFLLGLRGRAPSSRIVEEVIEEAGESACEWAEALCRVALSGEVESALNEEVEPETVSEFAAIMAPALLRGKPTGSPLAADALLDLAGLHTPPKSLRMLFGAATPEARSRWIARELRVDGLPEPLDEKNARYLGRCVMDVLPIADLCTASESRSVLARAMRLLSSRNEHVALLGHLDRALAGHRYEPALPTEGVKKSLAYNIERFAPLRRLQALPEKVAAACDRVVEIEDAAELASLEAWTGASNARREAIAAKVANAIGEDFRLDGFEEPPRGKVAVATLVHAPSTARFVLVPGGCFEMGLSPAEEEVLRSAAEKHSSSATYHEEFGHLLENLHLMRPIRRVSLAPMLVSQVPLGKGAIDVLSGKKKSTKAAGENPLMGSLSIVLDILERSPFRLLSEAEWEYVSRAGFANELTWRGNERPTADFLKGTDANAFGLKGLGFYPEVCADAFLLVENGRETYEGAPCDGKPVLRRGPRVVRGGAASLYPWQNCGEWHLLCSAVRQSQEAWDNEAMVRLTLGLRIV